MGEIENMGIRNVLGLKLSCGCWKMWTFWPSCFLIM